MIRFRRPEGRIFSGRMNRKKTGENPLFLLYVCRKNGAFPRFLSSSVGFPDTGQVNKFNFFVKIFKVMF